MATRKKTTKKIAKQNIEKSREAAPLYVPGSTGLRRYFHYVDEELHPKLRGRKAIKVFREMNDNNPICGTVHFAMSSFIQQADIQIESADDSPLAMQIRDHVESCYYDMKSTPREFMSDVLSFIWAGWSMFGKYYKIRRGPDATIDELRSKNVDGLVGWNKLEVRSQETIEEWDFKEPSGDILGCWQVAMPNYKRTYLDAKDHLHFRTVSNRNNPEGRSLYRNAYRSYFFLKRIEELEAIGIERDMAGVMVFFMPVEYLLSDSTTAQQSTVEQWRKVVERARRGEHEGLVFPTPDDADGKTGFDLKLLQSGGRRPIDTNEIIKRIESRIALTMLGEGSLLGMQGNVGSWSLHSGKTHMLAVATKSIMSAIEDQINRDAIPNLVAFNGWPVELAPEFSFGDIESDESGELATALASLTSAGLMTPDKDLEKYLRVRMGLPLMESVSNMQVQDAFGELQERENQPGYDNEGPVQIATQAVVPIEAEKESPSSSLSVDDAADIVGVNRSRIQGALRRGQLPGARVGNEWRIMREDLVQYMRGNRSEKRWKQGNLFA